MKKIVVRHFFLFSMFEKNCCGKGFVRLSRTVLRSPVRLYAHDAAVSESRLARQPGRRNRTRPYLPIRGRCHDGLEPEEVGREEADPLAHEGALGRQVREQAPTPEKSERIKTRT